MPWKAAPLESRFWSLVDIKGFDECWNWKLSKDKNGYGSFKATIERRCHKKFRAHRMAWILSNGEIPIGFLACHKCDNTSCCNPNRLFLGTAMDNKHDCLAKQRNNNPKGTNHWKCKLSENQVKDIIKEYKTGTISQSKLGFKYGISQTTIWGIVNGKKWTHIKVDSMP